MAKLAVGPYCVAKQMLLICLKGRCQESSTDYKNRNIGSDSHNILHSDRYVNMIK